MINKPVIGVAAAVAVLAAGAWYYLHSREASPSAPAAALQPPAAASTAPPEEPAIQHPLPASPEGTAANTPLPALADSDAPLMAALSQVIGASAVRDYLLPENIIRHLVVTIDNLPRQKVPVEKRPTSRVAGSFVVDGDELHATLDPRNFARYQPLVAAIGQVDMHRLAAVYVRFYPLFQNAYQDLGYPNGYFNDRLVQAIDSLLATPQTTGPIELVRPNVMYTYADPAMESRPAGQKLLIRMGPDNTAIIKAKLEELRQAITAAPPKK